MVVQQCFSDHHASQELRMDALRELGNIGSGRAVTALSQLLKKKVNMRTPRTGILDFAELLEAWGGAERFMVVILVTVEGQISGRMFFLMEPETAQDVIALLLGESQELDNLTEMADSLLLELGNILISSYFSSLADLTGLQMVVSTPRLCIDMLGAAIGEGISEVAAQTNRVLAIDAEILDPEGGESQTPRIAGMFCFLPDPQSMEPLYQALGV